MSISSIVKLRACDRCRFVFDMTEYNGNRNCPLCQFSTHSATIIHGKRAKEFLKTQEPMQKRLLAIKREEAILQFERDIEHAATIKRNIVKEKLNISSHNDALDAASLTNIIKASPTFQEWVNRQNQRLATQPIYTPQANPTIPTGGVIKFTHEDQEKEEPETKKT